MKYYLPENLSSRTNIVKTTINGTKTIKIPTKKWIIVSRKSTLEFDCFNFKVFAIVYQIHEFGKNE